MANAVYYHLGTTMIKLPNQTVHDMLDHAVKCHTKQECQAQHKATWVMAMEAAANAEIPMEKEVSCYNLRKAIKKLSCPPLQTNKETNDGR